MRPERRINRFSEKEGFDKGRRRKTEPEGLNAGEVRERAICRSQASWSVEDFGGRKAGIWFERISSLSRPRAAQEESENVI